VELEPRNLTFEQAATVPLAAMTALQGLRDTAAVQRGERVLIVGASGGAPSPSRSRSRSASMSQACAARGTSSWSSPSARITDYTKEDFTRESEKYDVILQLAGPHCPLPLTTFPVGLSIDFRRWLLAVILDSRFIRSHPG
jgi:hypothetical protein